ncbi:thiamine phosphate synthase [Campylobacter volucris]|uniref:Thiamine phosphate synthase n=1 Tax=Campylobacter volucris TaxID=1031542 RepID=A0AAE5YI70_9BACT|nr:thiamine phosphate synthase [Campylobacter volucris]AJC94424.1 thiamine monophosphate synthase/TENI family protein [Campylobacter volucris LMG 24379]KAB0579013.1 thiamine phosphate synthase [Campylobacter volucris]QBL13220.1 thiamine phosphate synthase [Campylobacter volucris]QEL08641.1 thiamine phosphate synthase (TMP-TENI domain) [Campylobacter volucris]TDJ81218.1 thiamine phosphate synthase [Campylobacter volucris]
MWDKKIIAISDSQNTQGDFLNFIEKLSKSSIDALVLREKHLNATEYYELAKEVLRIFSKNNKICFLHFYHDVCLRLNHQYFHSPFQILKNEKYTCKKIQYIGVSIHSKQELKQSYQYNVNHAFYGHIFPSSCKQDLTPKGILNLQEILLQSKIPIYAIGGINIQTISFLKDLNLAGICMREALYKNINLNDYLQKCRKMLH